MLDVGPATMGWKISASVVAVAVVAGIYWMLPARQEIPAHLKRHPLVDVGRGFLDDATIEALLEMTRSIRTIGTAARDYDMYTAAVDHIGEAVPVNTDGSCPALFLMPNGDKTRCVFPGRSDVGRHYIKSGGTEGRKESFDLLASRVQPFQKLMFDWSQYGVANKLMADEKFTKLARDVCPKDKQLLDPFQFNIIAQVPGQTVATHIDAPVFMYGTRQTAPQWLLAAMVFSGLFQEDYVNQVQLVGYFHKWNDTNRGGKFFFWNDDNATPRESDPVSGSANSVDGVKVVHAAGLYMPNHKPPLISKDAVNVLEYQGQKTTGAHQWDVIANGNVLRSYDEDELRFSAVYRARCFANDEERQLFKDNVKQRAWTVDHILSRFEEDMKIRGAWPFDAADSVANRATPSDRYKLGVAIMDTYIKYPYSPNAWFPLNYCALDRVVPSLAPLLKPVCN
jgi:hypothetical protein